MSQAKKRKQFLAECENGCGYLVLNLTIANLGDAQHEKRVKCADCGSIHLAEDNT